MLCIARLTTGKNICYKLMPWAGAVAGRTIPRRLEQNNVEKFVVCLIHKHYEIHFEPVEGIIGGAGNSWVTHRGFKMKTFLQDPGILYYNNILLFSLLKAGKAGILHMLSKYTQDSQTVTSFQLATSWPKLTSGFWLIKVNRTNWFADKPL